MRLVLLVVFVVLMILWFLGLVAGTTYPAVVYVVGWLPFGAVVCLGLAVFLGDRKWTT